MRRARQATQAQQRPLRDAFVWHPASEPPKLIGWFWVERLKGAEKTSAWFEQGEWMDVFRRPTQVVAWASDIAEEDGQPFAYRPRKTPPVTTYSGIARLLGVNVCALRYWVLENGCPLSEEGARYWLEQRGKL